MLLPFLWVFDSQCLCIVVTRAEGSMVQHLLNEMRDYGDNIRGQYKIWALAHNHPNRNGQPCEVFSRCRNGQSAHR